MSDPINQSRRHFLRDAAMTIAATEFALMGSADARSRKTKPAALPTVKPGTNTSAWHSSAHRHRPPGKHVRGGNGSLCR
jgi:hypothetical protein